MNIKNILQQHIQKVLEKFFQIENMEVELQKTKADFEGDFTLVTFPLVKILKKSPEIIATEIGEKLVTEVDFIENYNIVKGFLNLKLSDKIFIENFENIKINLHNISPRNETIMVEYS